MTKDEAIAEFRQLVARYGLQWTNETPRVAFERIAEINKVLSADDKCDALGIPRRRIPVSQ